MPMIAIKRTLAGKARAPLLLLHPRRGFDAHEIERARQLRAHVRDAGRPPALPVAARLVQNRISMVERVEGLRQPERVFGENGELERSHDLFNDFVES